MDEATMTTAITAAISQAEMRILAAFHAWAMAQAERNATYALKNDVALDLEQIRRTINHNAFRYVASAAGFLASVLAIILGAVVTYALTHH